MQMDLFFRNLLLAISLLSSSFKVFETLSAGSMQHKVEILAALRARSSNPSWILIQRFHRAHLVWRGGGGLNGSISHMTCSAGPSDFNDKTWCYCHSGVYNNIVLHWTGAGEISLKLAFIVSSSYHLLQLGFGGVRRCMLGDVCLFGVERSTPNTLGLPSHRRNPATHEQKGITHTIIVTPSWPVGCLSQCQAPS